MQQFVGNDIVAYKHTRCVSKWQDELFIKKIVLPKEYDFFLLQQNKNACLWMLWTIKEAAYKLSCFLGNRNKFHANQFAITTNYLLKNEDILQYSTYPVSVNDLEPVIINQVQYKNESFFAKTIITQEYIHSIVSNYNTWKNIINRVGVHSNFNKNDFSKEVRTFTMQELQDNGIVVNSIEKDKDGIPFVVTPSFEKYISLSHDQQFVSFAFLQNQS